MTQVFSWNTTTVAKNKWCHSLDIIYLDHWQNRAFLVKGEMSLLSVIPLIISLQQRINIFKQFTKKKTRKNCMYAHNNKVILFFKILSDNAIPHPIILNLLTQLIRICKIVHFLLAPSVLNQMVTSCITNRYLYITPKC